MPAMCNNAPARKVAGEAAASSFTLSPQRPREFASIILKQACITSLSELHKVLAGDAGTPVEMRRRGDGSGFEFVDKEVARHQRVRNGWYILERPPGSPPGDPPRMRVFNTFEGAAAEFVVKLKIHDEGSLTVVDVAMGGGREASRFVFEAPSRTMIMAPVATPLTGLIL